MSAIVKAIDVSDPAVIAEIAKLGKEKRMEDLSSSELEQVEAALSGQLEAVRSIRKSKAS